MTSEIIFFLLTFASLGFVTICFYLGKSWLYVCVTCLVAVSAIISGKLITVFGFVASIGTPIYAGIFLATDALSEFHGKSAAYRSVLMGFFTNIIIVICGLLVVQTQVMDGDIVGDALSTLFDFVPRLVLGGAIAYLLAQSLDVYIFHFIKKRLSGRHLWLRNIVSTIISQFFDSVIVYTIAFWGIVDSLWSIILVAWCMKIFVALVDTPFIYFMRRKNTLE